MSIIRQGESGRLAVLAAVVIAVILGAFVTINELVITSADEPDAEMALIVPLGDVDCPSGPIHTPPQRKCACRLAQNSY